MQLRKPTSPGIPSKKIDKDKLERRFGEFKWDGSHRLAVDEFAIHRHHKYATHPVKVEFKDVNKDGYKDAVMTFGLKGATAFGHDNVLSELYLYTYVDGEPVVAFDTATIVKKKHTFMTH